MYVPSHFKLEERAEIAALIRRHGFALLVTALPGAAPKATHLPLLFDEAPEPAGAADSAERPWGRLLGHLARANDQWRDFEALSAAGGEALAVFQGPHGYVSPSWYAPGPAVPTWNYLAVHAYGPPRIIIEPNEVLALLGRMTAEHEEVFTAPWRLDSQTPRYLEGMARGVVAFEIPIARVEAKAKLSQNRPEGDRRQVAAALEASGDREAEVLAGEMLKHCRGVG